MGQTSFTSVYDRFLAKITDDMFMELTKEDTYRLLQDLLLSALYKFEFPRVDIMDYTINKEEDESGNEKITAYFNNQLTSEEINIIATYMVVEWIGQQLASVEITRMKYSGSDFKFTSQANHLAKLLAMKQDYEREGFQLQRLYKRKKYNKKGEIVSTMDALNTYEGK